MKLMVIDGNSIVNRAYYGIRPLSTRDGLYTHAIYGFLTTLQRLLDEEQPEALCVTFDRREPTFRHQADERYKAQRKGMPEELAMQLPYLKQVLSAMNIPQYDLTGYEADDLIGTISRRCEAAGWDCVIVTGDKDSLQLITPHTKVKLVSTRMGQTTTKDMTEETFREQYGFAPIHMIDLKALMGDASDNIPGVPGVGEKTAMALVQQYHSLAELYRLLPEIDAKPGVIKKLQEGRESAEHSRYLATIVTDAPLNFTPEDNLRRPFAPELYDLLLKLEFQKLIDRYGLTPHRDTEAAPEYTVTVEPLETEQQAQALLAQWRQADHVTVYALPDLSVLSVQWDTGAHTSAAAELDQNRYTGPWRSLLSALFSADIRKVGHHIKDTMRALLEQDLPIEGYGFDTALAAYLLDATAGSYDLQRLFVTYYNEELPKPLHLEPDAFAPLADTASAWAALHSYCSAVEALYETLPPKLEELGMKELYHTVELPLCPVLARMEQRGFLVDAKALSDFGESLTGTIRRLEQRIYDAAGAPFNINSPKQLGKVLFEDLQLPHGKKTKTGWSTNADVLEELRLLHPVVDKVLRYRTVAKLKSTYCDGLLKVIGPDGRVHSTFNQTETRTGRISSAEPNLQNIPVRTPIGRELRKFFASEHGLLVDADYSQIELRVLAHVADDAAMKEDFLEGRDIHTATAARVFQMPVDMVTKDMRSKAKAVNFGIVYGIGAFSLSKDIGVTRKEADDYIKEYLKNYSGVDAYMKRVVEQAKEQGYVETLFGRRRYLPELKSGNFNMRAFGERVARNMPIQGAAADIIKIAMIRVSDRLAREGLQGRLILQVHDELIVECPPEEREQVERILQEEMEGAVSLSVPMVAEAGSGRTWFEAKE